MTETLPPPTPTSHPAPAPAPTGRRRWPWIVGGATAALLIIGAVTGAGEDPAASSAPATTAAPAVAAVPAPAPAPAPAPTAAPAPAPAAAPAAGPAEDVAAGTMPDVVCLDLQAAQDTIQAETGLFFSDSHDATGQDRMQVMDRNWLVVGQQPAAGTALGGDDIPVLDVVKYGEGSC